MDCARYQTRKKGPIMHAAFSYYGGKSALASRIIQYFPSNFDTYVEPFCGSCAILFAGPRAGWAEAEVVNDINGDLVHFLRTLRTQPHDLAAWIAQTPFSREEYNFSWDLLKGHTVECSDPIARAGYFYVLMMQSFGNTAKKNSWAIPVSGTLSKRWEKTRKTAHITFDLLSHRLLPVKIENHLAEKVVSIYDREKTFFYIDPPYANVVYPADKAKVYHTDMVDEQHETEFIPLLLSIKGMAIVSGYQHSAYDTLLEQGWRREDFAHGTSVNGTYSKRTESIWLNPQLIANIRQPKLW